MVCEKRTVKEIKEERARRVTERRIAAGFKYSSFDFPSYMYRNNHFKKTGNRGDF